VPVEDDLKPTESQFRLEALEPRILLSADPISGEFARLIADSETNEDADDIAALILEMDQTASLESESADSTFDDAADDDVTIDWPDGWLAEDEADDSEAVVSEKIIRPVKLAENDTLVSTNFESTNASTDFELLTDRQARAPPPAEQAISTDNEPAKGHAGYQPIGAGDTVPDGVVSLSDKTLVGIDKIEPRLLIDGTVKTEDLGDDLDLTDATVRNDVALLLSQAISYWQAYADAVESPGGELHTALAALPAVTVVTDSLDGRDLASNNTDTDTITLDLNAAGYGWYVDDDATTVTEFSSLITNLEFRAPTGSALEGQVDLFTVLLHEVGHLLDVDHDANPVMGAELSTGARIILGGTLDLTAAIAPGAVTITIAVDGTIDVEGIVDGIGDPVVMTGLIGIIRVIDDGDLELIINGPDQTSEWTLFGSGGQANVYLDALRLDTIGFEGFTDLLVLNAGTLDDDFTIQASFASAATQINADAGNDRLLIVQGAQFAGFDGGPVSIDEIDTVINQAGADDSLGAPSLTNVENRIDQPLLFIHGFGGTLGADTSEAGQLNYLTHRGLSPDQLVLEPLANSYSDIIASLVNVGYDLLDVAEGIAGTLVNAIWDWRVPVAETDGDNNGVLANATWDAISSGLDAVTPAESPTFDTALDYLIYWMDQALTAWETMTGSVVDAVDLITHSTGGLVSRSYLQSAAYQNRASTPGAVLPTVNTLIQVGAPNQGSGSIFNILENDFSQKQATRVLSLSLKQAYELFVADNTNIKNPDGTDLKNADGTAITSERQFIAAYIGTLNHLLAIYPFIDNSDLAGDPLGTAALVDTSGNDLLSDLNSDIVGAVEYDGFVGDTANTYIVYGTGEETGDLAVARSGFSLDAGTSNEILTMTDFLIGSLPDDGQLWYELTQANYSDGAGGFISGGDGTVSEYSASFGFAPGILNPQAGVEHTGLVYDDTSQQAIVSLLLGVVPAAVPLNLMSQDLAISSALTKALNVLKYGILPIEPIVIGGVTIGLTPEGIANFLALFDSEDNAFKFSDSAVIQVDEFLLMSGTFSFEADFDQILVDVTTQLPGDIASLLGFGAEIPDVPMTMWKITAEDVTAFVGINGWQDLDGDGKASFTLPDGTVVGDGDGDGIVDTIEGPEAGVFYGDLNGNGLVEPGETAEFETDRVGLAIQDLDVAIALLRGSLAAKIANPLYRLIPNMHAVTARAASAELVGMEALIGISVEDIVVEVNSGGKWRKGLDFRPVADFSSNFPSELLYIDELGVGATNNNGILEVSDAVVGTALWNALNDADVLSGNGDGVVTYQELVDQYDAGTDPDGFVSTTELPLLADADLEGNGGNGDGIIDDAGVWFPLAGGSDGLVIDFNANQRIGASAAQAVVNVGGFVQLVGGFSVEKGPREQIDVATRIPGNLGDLLATVVDGLTALQSLALEALQGVTIPSDLVFEDPALSSDVWNGIKDYYLSTAGTALTNGLLTSAELKALIEEFQATQVWVESDLSTIHNLEVETLQFGMFNVLAFAGIGGPYWSDQDGDNRISFTDDLGNTLTALDAGGFVAVVVGTDGREYGDINQNGAVDVGETGEFNPNSVGLAITGADVGFVQMTSTLAGIPGLNNVLPKLYALQGNADFAGVIGLSDLLTARAADIRFEVNTGSNWVKGIEFGPVADFESSFPGELARLDTSGNGGIEIAELSGFDPATFTAIDTSANGSITYEELLAYYDNKDNAGLPFMASRGNDLLEITEVAAAFQTATGGALVDADGDGKIDPAGYEIRTATGANPIYITSPGAQVFGATTGDIELRTGGGLLEIIAGGMSVQKGPSEVVDVATGIPRFFGELRETLFNFFVVDTVTALGDTAIAALADAGLLGGWVDGDVRPSDAILEAAVAEWKRRGLVWIESDLSVIHNLEVSTLQIGFAEANAFFGLNPPAFDDADGNDIATPNEYTFSSFWSDLDGSGGISFALPDGTQLLDDTDADGFVDVVAIGDAEYGDKNENGVVDIGESAELEDDLLGIVIADANFGFVKMAPTLALIPGLGKFLPDFSAAFATASSAAMVGLQDLDVQLVLEDITLFMNDGKSWLGIDEIGTPVVNFQTSFPGELLALDLNGNGQVERFLDGLVALQNADGSLSGEVANDELTYAEILEYYDRTLAAGNGNDVLDLVDDALPGVMQGIDTDFDNVITEEELLAAFDSDNDGMLMLLTDSLAGLDWTGNSDNIMTFEELLARYDTGGAQFLLPTLDLDGNGQVDRALDGLAALQDADDGDGVLTYEEVLAYYDNTDTSGDGTGDGNGIGDGDGELHIIDDVLPGVMQGVDTDSDNVITKAELLAAFDNNNDELLDLATESLEAFDWTGNLDDIMTLEELVALYSSGALELGEDALPAVLQGIDADNDGKVDPRGYEVSTGTDTESVYLEFDGNQQFGGRVGWATGSITEFVHISGSLDFAMNVRQTVKLADGALVGTFTPEDFGLPANLEIPVFGESQEMEFITLGGTVQAFIGINGPYFTDDDGDHLVDATEINPDAVGIAVTDFSFGLALMKPSNPFMQGLKYFALKATASGLELVGMPGVTLKAENLLVEINQSTPNAFGVSILPVIDFASSFVAELANLDRDGDGVIERTEDSLLAFAAADGAGGGSVDEILTFDELIAQYDLDADGTAGHGELELDELPAVATGGLAMGLAQFDFDGSGDLDFDELIAAYDTNNDGKLQINEDSLAGINATVDTSGNGAFEYAELLAAFQGTGSGNVLNLAKSLVTVPSVLFYADKDRDGLLDPQGLGIGTGGQTAPVYLEMDSFLVRAQGQVEMDFLGALTVVGSVAFELGPTQDLTLENGNTITANTLSIGASGVSAFLGSLSDGRARYWVDGNTNNEVDDGELDPGAIGIAITDLDIGLALFAAVQATNPADLGVYLAGKADVPEEGIGLVNVPGVDATGSFAIDINIGLGVGGLSPIDFQASFPGDMGRVDTNGTPGIQLDEVATIGQATFDLIDTSGDGNVTYEELLAYYDVVIGDDDGQLELDDDFLPAALATADADGDQLFDPAGYQVNTGDSDSPVYLDFDKLLINFELEGRFNIMDVAQMNGAFLFNVSEVDSQTQLSVLAIAQMSLGPDVSAGSNFFSNQIIGALVLNGDGIAADIQSNMSLGGDLGFIDLGAAEINSRLILNNTGDWQTIAIPERFAAVLELNGLTTASADNPIVDDGDGNLSYVIQPNAPGTMADGSSYGVGPYLVVTFNAKFEILNTIFFDGDFRLTATSDQIHLTTGADLTFKFLGVQAFNMQGNFDLLISSSKISVTADAMMSVGLLGSLKADGEFIIDGSSNVDTRGIRARLIVTGELGSEGIGLQLGTVSGAAELNTTKTDWNTGAGTTVKAESLTIAGATQIDFVGLADGTGTFLVAFDSSGFQLALKGTLNALNSLSFYMDAFVGVFANGVVVSAGVSLNIGNIGDGFISGTLAGRLQINTTPDAVPDYTGVTIAADGRVIITPNVKFVNADGAQISGIAGKSFLLDIKGSLSILNAIDVSGRVLVDIDQTGWTIAGSLGLSLDVFGLASGGLGVSFELNSDGEFEVNLTAQMVLGPSDFNLSGQVTLNIMFADGNDMTRGGTGPNTLDAYGGISIGATIFGISLGTIDLDFELQNGRILIKVGNIIPVPFINSTVVDLGWFGDVRIYYPDIKWKSYTFTVGTLDIEPVPQPVLAALDSGVLTLNVGPLAGDRNLRNDENEEIVLIDQRGGRVYVTMFGVEQSDPSWVASDIDKIVLGDMGLGDDYLKITENVTVDVEVHFGDGNDILVHNGSGTVTAYGDGDNDRLTGGGNNDMLDGGTGEDVLRGRGGLDSIYGGDGNYEDAIFWAVGDGIDTRIDGGDGKDRFTIEAADGSPLNATISAAGTGFTAAIVGNGTLSVSGVEAATLLGDSAADVFTINDLRSSLLDQVSLDLGSGTATDRVIVNGSGGSDVIDLSSQTSVLATSVTGGTAEAPTSELVETDVDVISIASDGSVTIDISSVGGSFGSDTLAINTLGAVDTITVDSVRAGLATMIDAGTGSDIITISSEAGTLNGIDSKLTIIGNEPPVGSDYLYIDDSGDSDPDVYTLESGNLSSNDLAPGGIDYTGIEHLIVTLGSGGDTFTIKSTHDEETILNAGNGNDVINVKLIDGVTTINGDGGVDTTNVGSNAAGTTSVGNENNNSLGDLSGIDALLTVNGNATSSDVLNVDNSGVVAADSATLTSSTLTGLSFAASGSITYGSLENLNIYLGSGADTFNVTSTSVLATVRTGTGSEDNVVNVGSVAPGVGGTVDNINGRLHVIGQSTGTDTINVDETGEDVETDVEVAILTNSVLTGLGMAGNAADKGIQYTSVDVLNINLGSAIDTFNVRSTHANTITTLRTGTGGADNIVNIGSQASLGDVNGIAGKLYVIGESAGTETLNVDETGDDGTDPGNLTSTVISGLGIASNNVANGIDYTGFDDLNIDLGTGNDTFTIESTHIGTTDLDAGGGADVVNIQKIDGITTVAGGTGSDHINVGTMAAGTQGNPTNNSLGTLNEIDASLTINGTDPDTGSDSLLIDDTDDSDSNTGILTAKLLTGLNLAPAGITYGTIEHLTIRLGDGGNTFTIDNTHGFGTSTQETTTLETGGANDLITINDVTDTLTVNAQGGDDEFVVARTNSDNGTGDNSTSNLNGDGGNDEFHVRSMDGQVFIKGGANDDRIYVTDITATLLGAAPALPAEAPTSQRTTAIGSVDQIDALLDVEGNDGTDRMFIDGSAAPPADERDATLTSDTLNGMGLSADGIIYGGLEFLTIWMDLGANTMTIEGTHGTTTSIYMADGLDIVDVNDASGFLYVYGEQAADEFNIRATASGSTLSVFGQEGVDTFNVSDDTTYSLPGGDYPVGAGPPDSGTFAAVPLVAQTFGTVDGIQGFVDIYGGTGTVTETDQLNIDDSANPNPKRGTLTSNTLTGMNMPDGVRYHDIEDLNLWLGTKSDILYIDSTHAGTTQIYGGDGITGIFDSATGTPNRDDTIAINTISGETTIFGQGGNDLVLVNVTEEVPGGAFIRTHVNGVGVAAAELNLTGNGGSDEYIVNLAGLGEAIINVHDNGALNDGADTLTINGADQPAANPDDTFLLRRDFVALLNDLDGDGVFDQVERVNYDENINARLIVNGLFGDDDFVADDNSSITTLDGGPGTDSFQIGQIFGTQRDADAGVAAGDEFTTTAVIIGVITDPDPDSDTFGDVIFNPTLFSVGQDELDDETVAAIQAAIDYQNGQVDGNGLLDPQPLAGVAYLSDGVSFATTVYGGDGEDLFSVYRNVGTLRLEGEAGDDTFIVRAFVTIDIDAEQQAETEINGGLNKDLIQYAINAPVSIDGGDGFDTVIVLGTPFGDDFVVSEDGIFGAGLNVRFENVESAILDTLEGDDRIYILSTKPGVITTVIGGLGNDLIEIGGDVDPDATIYSNDLAGRAGVIEHSFTSSDLSFATAGVNGVAVNVRGASANDSVIISPTGEPLTVSEDGDIASYMITLVNPVEGDISATPVYLTIAAGMVSTSDRELNGDSILISLTPTGGYAKSLVLTFDGSGSLTQTIYVKAIDDGAEEGERIALISHSINSAHEDFEDLPMVDIFVNVIDDDKPGIAITEINTESVFGSIGDVDGLTEVLEGGFTDQYEVVLTKRPDSGETVTVHLFTDTQISLSESTLEFNEFNWNIARQVTVEATAKDGKDGNTLSTIRHTITNDSTGTTDGGAYDSIGDDETVGLLDVTVYDQESAGAIIRQSDGSTEVVGDGTDSYFVRLTRAPTANVALTPTTDGQTLVSPTTVIFTTGDWDKWVEIVVSADPNAPTSTSAVKVFETSSQDLNRIQGPLIVEGGVGGSVDQALRPALVLPNESNEAPEANILPTAEGDDLDVLNIFHTDNSDQDVGDLFYRDSAINPGTGLIEIIANPGVALAGFEMAGARLAGSAGFEQLFGGGITMNDFEIVEILLGKGDETLTIDDTLDDAITVIHGGGGNDSITITNRGNGPLVVYGDTSEGRVRYSNSEGGANIHGSSFLNDGNDKIDASAMAEQGDGYVGLVIYGGHGNDTIDGSDDDDHIAGGTGNDKIRANAGNDHVYGDSHFNVDPMLFALDRLTPFGTNDARVASMFTVPVTNHDAVGSAGTDTIFGDDGDDIVFGDHGVIDLLEGTRRLATTGNVINVVSAGNVIADGAADTIHGGNDNDLLIGGALNDTIYGDLGSDLIFGDHGQVTAAAVGGLINLDLVGTAGGMHVSDALTHNAIYTSISITGVDYGGNDTLYGGTLAVLDIDTGSNIILGQQGSDTIYGGGSDDDIYGGHNVVNGYDTGDYIDGGAGNDVILGDNGTIERTESSTGPRFRTLTGTQIYDADGLIQVSGTSTANPDVVERREIVVFNHDNNDGGVQDNYFGNDTIAGGADDDVIFGQLGNDNLHGDGALNDNVDGLEKLLVTISVSDVGGDDYIEGNGGTDTVYGGLGQDDIIGGSSELFGLADESQRPDGSDVLYGGNGDLISRNNFGEGVTDETGLVDDVDEAARHARDADTILGDNGNIFRLVGTNGALLTFVYDNYDSLWSIVVRAAKLLDYTPGGFEYNEDAQYDNGDADTIRGEAGDDAIYGMVGDDKLFGDAQSDDVIGGYGNDWISGGTGSDGILGDDGRILTSRNAAGEDGDLSEPIYGIGVIEVDRNESTLEIATPGDLQQSFINQTGELKKTVVLLPFNVQGGSFQDPLYDALNADDIIYGGLGDDFLHGGSGDDAISGAEALPEFFNAPTPQDNVLGFSDDTLQFADYDEFTPLEEIPDFLLNFNAGEGAEAGTDANGNTVYSDGNDRIFGDLGNDWLVGGTGNDHLYGGWGDDLMNADDDHQTNVGLNDKGLIVGLNDVPDTAASYEDIAFGGAGRDILIANTGGDRLIDWAGEFNTYLVPFAPFGAFTISRSLQPGLFEYLYDLSEADGADQFRGGDPLRNGEPDGEIGLVMQKDFAWQDQTGAPKDVQPGNIPGGARDVLRGADFNSVSGSTDPNGNIIGFAADSGSFTVENGRLEVSPEFLDGDAVSVFYVDEVLPGYFEITATVNADKPTGGYKSNAYIIFDYQSPTDFKFAGINVSTNKLVMGHRTADGWIIDEQTPARLKPNRDYNVLLSINGSVATLVVNNVELFTHVYETRVDIYGVVHGVSDGMVGIGAENSTARVDNLRVQVLPPEITFEETETFNEAPVRISYDGLDWMLGSGSLVGTPAIASEAMATVDLDVGALYILRAQATIEVDGTAGFFFDRNGSESYKFVVISPDTNEVMVGHYTARGGIVIDQAVSFNMNAKASQDVEITLAGTTVSVVVNGNTLIGYAFNANVVDGDFGLLTLGGEVRVDEITYMTDDAQYLTESGDPLVAAAELQSESSVDVLRADQLMTVVDAVLDDWLTQDYIGIDQYEQLKLTRFFLTDLPDDLLGLAKKDAVYVDTTAAGNGWFVDGTPLGKEEFVNSSDGTLYARANADAIGQMDLVSVVTHELGHLLGLSHDDGSAMNEILAAGVRSVELGYDDADPKYEFKAYHRQPRPHFEFGHALTHKPVHRPSSIYDDGLVGNVLTRFWSGHRTTLDR